ncbi:MAG: ABC transporter permease, partial [Pseudomonadota bacterium]
MSEIWDGLQAAFWMIVRLDPDLVEITLRSLHVSLTALVIACAIALPLGTWLAIRRFRYRRAVIATLNALMGLPPVVVGLIVYLLLSRAGPFGVLGLLFTPTAMIVAQVIIITPLIASITHQAMRELWAEYHDLLISLHTSKLQRVKTLLWDGRRTLLTASLAGFGRGIGEVGAIMI